MIGRSRSRLQIVRATARGLKLRCAGRARLFRSSTTGRKTSACSKAIYSYDSTNYKTVVIAAADASECIIYIYVADNCADLRNERRDATKSLAPESTGRRCRLPCQGRRRGRDYIRYGAIAEDCGSGTASSRRNSGKRERELINEQLTNASS